MRAPLFLTLTCLLSVVACSDDVASGALGADAAVTPASNVPSGDSGILNADATVPSGSDAAPPATAKIPLLVWVDDLVDHHTRDDAIPDTVDDKNIADDENPSAFDSRFQ